MLNSRQIIKRHHSMEIPENHEGLNEVKKTQSDEPKIDSSPPPITFLDESEFDKAFAKLTDGLEEERHKGAVSFKRYWSYFKAGGDWIGSFFLLLVLILGQTAYISTDWWLSRWTTMEESRDRNIDALRFKNQS